MVDTLRIKRRAAGGAAGAPTSLAAAEIAFNEQDNVLYYGRGNSGGAAVTIIPIGGPGGLLTFSDTAPTGPVPGQLWMQTSSGFLFVYWSDPDSNQWVQVR